MEKPDTAQTVIFKFIHYWNLYILQITDAREYGLKRYIISLIIKSFAVISYAFTIFFYKALLEQSLNDENRKSLTLIFMLEELMSAYMVPFYALIYIFLTVIMHGADNDGSWGAIRLLQRASHLRLSPFKMRTKATAHSIKIFRNM